MKKIKKVAVLFFLLALIILPSVAYGYEDMGGWNVPDSNDYGVPGGTISEIIYTIINWLLGLLGVLGLGGFAVAGIMYIIAGGEEKKIGQAKSIMLYSVIGVVVGILGYVAVNTIDEVLNYW